jgi:hypothetical protein
VGIHRAGARRVADKISHRSANSQPVADKISQIADRSSHSERPVSKIDQQVHVGCGILILAGDRSEHP